MSLIYDSSMRKKIEQDPDLCTYDGGLVKGKLVKGELIYEREYD